jgi:thioesterase domain-containing protein
LKTLQNWARKIGQTGGFCRLSRKRETTYEASMFTGDVVLLQSEEMVTSFVDPKMGWSNFVKGQILLYRIPGWHTDMFQDEGASLIAEYLRPLLERVDAARSRAVTAETSSI